MSRRRLAVLLAAVLTATLAPTAVAAPGHGTAASSKSGYDVTVRFTEYGIPHIKANDFGSLGFGYAHTLANETICVLADTYTTVRAERSRYFGPDGSYVFRGNGATVNNLASDFFFQQINDDKRIEKLIAQPKPHGPSAELKEMAKGYVAGYNAYLREIGGSKGVTDPTCKGKPWVHEINEIDVYRRFYQLALLASSGVAIDGIGQAQPPHPSAPIPTMPRNEDTARLLAEQWKTLAIGSNAIAVGSSATATKHGLLLGNPHFPWIGSERFYQAHLTVPGKLDVAGGSLLGVPLVLIGHTAHMAWSHTVSTAYRFTPFQLTLVPGSPTTYLYDGQPTPMTSRAVTVNTSATTKQTRTLYSTRFGPILISLLGLPIFPWTPTTAFAMGDANAPNFRYLNHFFEVDRAQSAKEVLQILKRNQGIPWVNTIATDDAGDALYADISVTPHVTNEQATTCNTEVGQATFAALRLPVLDGSRSACEWGSDPDSLQKGTFGPSHMPFLLRKDYVTNSNDSYWLSQPRQPLTGFAKIIGDEGTPRALRTRSGLVMMEEQLKKGGMTRTDMERLLFSDRQYAGELTRNDVVAMCKSFPGGQAPSEKGPVAVGNACDVLAKWDVRDGLQSRGALLFRRFWSRAAANPAPVGIPGAPNPIWSTQFDPADPVNTPRDLNTTNPLVQKAFGDALNDLTGAGIKVDDPLGTWQADLRPDGTKTSYHGGPGGLGVFNAVAASWNASKGYVGQLAHGSSFIQVVAFDGDGCPDASTILTYSQSPNPKSAHYSDQTKLFRDGGWVRDRFCEKDVAAGTLTTVRLTTGQPGGAAAGGPIAAPTGSLPTTGLPSGPAIAGLALLVGLAAARRFGRA
ncbi:MAG: penicillin acylase family protein [Frankiaceae bacterium]|nr:penicillin acylase family protein [Frankiaceae bacterium]